MTTPSPVKIIMTTPSPVKLITSVVSHDYMSLSHDYVSSSHDQGAVNINPQGQDCHFYFYSICSKGESCKFRHSSAALGSEVTCELWRDSTCRRKICAFRHCTFERQRSIIPCYWESQAMGCQKQHCPFMHSKPRPSIQGVRERINEYKLSSIKVKNLQELHREKARKKEREGRMEKDIVEEVKKEEREGRVEDVKKEREGRMEGVKKEREGRVEEVTLTSDQELVKGDQDSTDAGVTLSDLRQELVKRMLAEKKAFEEKHGKNRDAMATRIMTSVAIETKGHVMPVTMEMKRHVTPSVKAGDVNKVSLAHRNHDNVNMVSLPHRNHGDVKNRSLPHGNHSDVKVILNKKSKENSDQSDSKCDVSHDVTRTKLIRMVKATPTQSNKATPNPLDFKVKTLAELRAERSSTSDWTVSNSAKKEERGTRVPPEEGKERERGTHVPPKEGKERERGTRVPPKEGKERERGTHVPPKEGKKRERGTRVPPKEGKEREGGTRVPPEEEEEEEMIIGSGIPKKRKLILVRHKHSLQHPSTKITSPTTLNSDTTSTALINSTTLNSDTTSTSLRNFTILNSGSTSLRNSNTLNSDTTSTSFTTLNSDLTSSSLRNPNTVITTTTANKLSFSKPDIGSDPGWSSSQSSKRLSLVLGSSGSDQSQSWSKIKRKKENYESLKRESATSLSRGESSLGQGGHIKRGVARKINIVREKEVVKSHSAVDKGVEYATTQKMSLSDLKNEILLNLELPPTNMEDDVLLLEEMATYEDDDDVIGGRSNTDISLSDSRNDDDLILQMEEFL